MNEVRRARLNPREDTESNHRVTYVSGARPLPQLAVWCMVKVRHNKRGKRLRSEGLQVQESVEPRI